MQNVKFVQILRKLNKEEFKSFFKFLKSPIYNSNKTLIKLYDNIKLYYPNFASSGIEKENIYKKIFPKENYKEKKLRNLSSEMLHKAEGFLAFLRKEKNNTDKELDILSELTDRGIDKAVLKKYRLISNSFDKIKYKDASILFQMIRLNDIYKENTYYSQNSIMKNLDVTQRSIDLFNEHVLLFSLTM